MDIYIASEIGACNQFKPEPSGKKEVVSIVIYPLSVILEDKNIKVINGCNLWQGCFNSSCHFSRAGRNQPKVIKK